MKPFENHLKIFREKDLTKAQGLINLMPVMANQLKGTKQRVSYAEEKETIKALKQIAKAKGKKPDGTPYTLTDMIREAAVEYTKNHK